MRIGSSNSPVPQADTAVGTALGVAAVVLWGSTVALGRSLTAQLGPIPAAAAVYLLSGALALVYLLARRDRLRAVLRLPWKYLGICGSLFVLYVACFYLALGLAAGAQQAIEVGLINYLWPAATVVLSVPLLGKRARWTLAPGVALAVCGLAAVLLRPAPWGAASSLENLKTGWVPYLLALFAALQWALYSNLSRRWAGGAGAAGVPLFLVATAVVMGGLLALFPPLAPRWTTRTILELIYMGVFPTGLGYLFWEIAMRQGNFVRVATFSYFTPVISAVLAALYLWTWPGLGLWLGCLMIIAGAWLCSVSVNEPARQAPPAASCQNEKSGAPTASS